MKAVSLLTRFPLFLAALAPALVSPAVIASTQPVGVFAISLNGSADTAMSLPLERAPICVAMAGTVQGLSLHLPTVSGLDTLAQPGEYYYLVPRTGALEGAEIPIIGMTANSVTLAPLYEDLTLLPNEKVAIYPYWTPESLFAHTAVADRTQLFIYDTESAGVNKRPDAILTYFAGYGWYTGTFELANAYPLRRGDGLTVRQPKGTSDQFLNVVGNVPVAAGRRAFVTHADTGGDCYFGPMNPAGVVLSEAQLEFADRTAVFVYEGNRGYNPRPSKIYTFFQGYGWYDQLFSPVDASVVLSPGNAYVLRTPSMGQTQNWEWSPHPAYLDSL